MTSSMANELSSGTSGLHLSPTKLLPSNALCTHTVEFREVPRAHLTRLAWPRIRGRRGALVTPYESVDPRLSA